MRSPGWAVAATLLLSGCVAPAVDTGAFEQNALAALESAVSTTRVAALALDARAEERVTHAYANTVVTEAEDAIDPIEASFGVVDPPDRALDALRAEVLDQLADAGDLLAEARTAVRRGDSEAMASLADELRTVADGMEQRAEDLS
ncbi:hypothetical protein [Intrasporangium sp. DVR]|uniref:hypothetical protein n=1 Tax=Intrasporangium sp. DVR TaxID=3127867 RepID=UPI00313A556A